MKKLISALLPFALVLNLYSAPIVKNLLKKYSFQVNKTINVDFEHNEPLIGDTKPVDVKKLEKFLNTRGREILENEYYESDFYPYKCNVIAPYFNWAMKKCGIPSKIYRVYYKDIDNKYVEHWIIIVNVKDRDGDIGPVIVDPTADQIITELPKDLKGEKELIKYIPSFKAQIAEEYNRVSPIVIPYDEAIGEVYFIKQNGH